MPSAPVSQAAQPGVALRQVVSATAGSLEPLSVNLRKRASAALVRQRKSIPVVFVEYCG